MADWKDTIPYSASGHTKREVEAFDQLHEEIWRLKAELECFRSALQTLGRQFVIDDLHRLLALELVKLRKAYAVATGIARHDQTAKKPSELSKAIDRSV